MTKTPVQEPGGTPPAAPHILRLAPGDNVAIVVRPVETGEPFLLDGVPTTAAEPLPLGFKVATADLPEGTHVQRLGMTIGVTSHPVPRGQLVHLHNLESLYLRTHARGEA